MYLALIMLAVTVGWWLGPVTLMTLAAVWFFTEVFIHWLKNAS